MEEEILESRVQATPIGDFNWQKKPIDPNNCYLISQDEIEKLGKHLLKWSTENYQATEDILDDEGNLTGQRQVTKTRPILVPNDPTEENAIRDAQEEIAALKAELAKTDYEAIKFAEGEMSEIKYEPYRVKRKKARARINELQEMYNLE